MNLFSAAIYQLKNFKRLAVQYGQFKSIASRVPMDRNGEPQPWYTYPAIEYLSQLNFSDKRVFEWGSGNSSLFWSTRSKEIVAVESDEQWFNRMDQKRPHNFKLLLVPVKSKYVEAIRSLGRFDVIIVDGDHRELCAAVAAEVVSKTGMIILDNSDRYPKTAKKLRDAGLIQIDFFGFGPVNNYCWCTSIFLTRKFDFVAKNNHQPQRPLASSTSWKPKT